MPIREGMAFHRGSQSMLWSCGGSCRGLHEITHPHQVLDGRSEGEQLADLLHATEFHFA